MVNLVLGTGPRAGEPLVTHPDVPLISFTGSTVVGRRIQALTAPLTKKLSLEMGGKNACIVFDDANLDEAVPTVVRCLHTIMARHYQYNDGHAGHASPTRARSACVPADFSCSAPYSMHSSRVSSSRLAL